MPGPEEQSGNIVLVDIENDQPSNTYDFTNGATNHWINLPNITAGEENITVEEEVFTVHFPTGWSICGFPFDLSTITKIEYIKNWDSTNILHTTTNPAMRLQVYYSHQVGSFSIKTKPAANTQTDEEYINSARPNAIGGVAYVDDSNYSPDLDDIFYGPVSDTTNHVAGELIIVKDYAGAAFLPEWNFNGIGGISKFEGLQVKTLNAFQLRFHAKRNYRIIKFFFLNSH